ncbi:MAG: RluA family pseudouridine synthase [Patescibacteria group bacterium]
MKKLVVPEHEAGERLDAWLAQQYPDRSRTAFQKLIKEGGVSVNGKKAKAHLVVKSDDAVEIRTGEKTSAGKNARPVNFARVRVVDETPDFLVIEKPSGLLVHPAPSQKTATLVDFLVKHAPSIRKVGDAKERPGIVHRLDREASGLMVVAKSAKMFEHLKKRFQAHDITKEYLALVYGKVVKDFDVIRTSIGRKKGRGRMSARAKAQEGDKDAVSHYDVLERFPQATLVKVRTETGRMHQVRVHMKSIGHSLVGDALYGTPKQETTSLRKVRLFLHAAALGFTDLDGRRHEYRSELPPDLHAVIETLRSRHAK